MWVATFLSGPLTLAQMKLIPFSIQISVPILATALFWSYRILTLPVYKNTEAFPTGNQAST
jgi:hypothetical protein